VRGIKNIIMHVNKHELAQLLSNNFQVYEYVKDWASVVNKLFGTKVSIEDTVVST